MHIHNKHRLFLAWLFCLSLAVTASENAPAHPAFQMPVLKWAYGGCYSSWCETGWYSSPAVADLDGDGQAEVIASAYSIFVLDGANGALEWQVASGHDRSEPAADPEGRTWPGIVVADIDADGELEIVSAHGGGYVSVYQANGYFEGGWPQRPVASELRGLSVHDLDGDGDLEVLVTAAWSSSLNTWVFEHDGGLRSGWPQLNNSSGYAAGIYNANAAVGDMDGDQLAEVVVPSDVHYICAYDLNGVQLPAHPMYGGDGWGLVGVWESLATELRGWGECDGVRAESYRTNFAHGASVIADVNSDGQVEVIATGNMYDCSVGHPPGKYNGVYIFNTDRSRFNSSGFDWQAPPVDTGAPLTEDYGIIENNQPNPALADLDGDGNLEIVYASYDGRVHAFWLDKTEHGNWPYSVYNPAEGIYRFASEPAIADLDNDGTAEVIVTSWAQKGTGQTGRLHVLDYLGNALYEVSLPGAYGSPTWNGGLAGPTLANIDSDADLEVVVNTAHSGVVAYDLPGTAQARVLWGTGRGNYQRDGYLSPIPPASLEGSLKFAMPNRALPGGTVTYTILLHNPGPILDNASLSDPLPGLVSFAGNLWYSAGTASYANGVVSWAGAVSAAEDVTIHFDVLIDAGISSTQVIENTVSISDGLGGTWLRSGDIVVLGLPVFLPILQR